MYGIFICDYNFTFFSDKNIEGPATGTLKDIHTYARGKTIVFHLKLLMPIYSLENTEDPNSSYTQRILKSEPKTWQESLYKLYFRGNRLYKQITYYTWRFAELHAYKLVLFLMVLTSVLKVTSPSPSILYFVVNFPYI